MGKLVGGSHKEVGASSCSVFFRMGFRLCLDVGGFVIHYGSASHCKFDLLLGDVTHSIDRCAQTQEAG